MRQTNTFLALMAWAVLAVGCKKEVDEQPKVTYDNPKSTKTVKVDTTHFDIADLPIQITGTDYLIHPIGEARVTGAGKYASNGGGDISFTISNYNEMEITGYLHNLKFQHVKSDSLAVLTQKPVLIQTITLIKPAAETAKKQLLVYALADLDTNKDGTLDTNDIKSLYISSVSGIGFAKLSPELEEVLDWRHMPSVHKIYFRTVADTNKNGEFDKDDAIHYYFIDLNAAELIAEQYKPI